MTTPRLSDVQYDVAGRSRQKGGMHNQTKIFRF